MNANKAALNTALGVIVLWLATPLITFLLFPTDIGKQGQVGDLYGFITSLFTGITIVGLMYTIILQRQDIGIATTALAKQHEELELNRKELKLNRKELKQSRLEFEQQNRTLRYQRFDNTFFNMVNLHREIVNGLLPEYPFEHFENNHITRFRQMDKLTDIKTAFRQMSLTYSQQRFGQYISHFELIIDFIMTRKKKDSNRTQYLKIYFSQLSNKQKIFLYYYFNLAEDKKPQYWDVFKDILFEDVKPNHLLQPQHFSQLDGINLS